MSSTRRWPGRGSRSSNPGKRSWPESASWRGCESVRERRSEGFGSSPWGELVPFDAQYEEKGNAMNWKRTARWSWLILPFLLLALWPSVAAAWDHHRPEADVVLYEVWENVTGPSATGVIERVAAISGSAKIDTVVCSVVKFLNPTAKSCAVTAVGTNTIQLDATGVPVSIKASADFKALIEVDNPFDSPEGVVTMGSLSGDVFPLP